MVIEVSKLYPWQEREIDDVAEQFRKTASERDSAETKVRISSDENQELKLELMSANNDKKRLSDKNHELDREIMQYMQVTIHFYLSVNSRQQYQ